MKQIWICYKSRETIPAHEFMPKERKKPQPFVMLHKIAKEWSYKAGPFFVSSVLWLFFDCYICIYKGFPALLFLCPCDKISRSNSSKYSSFEDRLRKYV